MQIKKALKVSIVSTALAATSLVSADDSLILGKVNETPFLQNIGVSLGGWLDLGGTYNAHSPDDNFNSPVSFNDRHLEAQVNQVYLFVERAVNTEGNSFDIGFRADVLFGTDARFTLNDDLDDDLLGDDYSRFYRLSFPQLYVEVFAPVLNGVSAKIGHFYTIIGNEVVTSPDNFFYSHAYTMLYAEPFEHNGVLFSTPINDDITLMAGGVLGWDNFSRDTDVWNFLGGVSWQISDATNVTITAIEGEISEARRGEERFLYSIVANHDFSDKLHYTFQHDHAREDVAGGGEVEWYGINQYLVYDVNDQMSAGLRAEWFRDDDGARVTGVPGSFFAITGGVNYTPPGVGWLKLRPEVRYDWVDSNGNGDAFDGATDNEQLTVAVDVVVNF